MIYNFICVSHSSPTRSRQPLKLTKCASKSFARYAVNTLMDILMTTYLTGNMDAAEECCKKLKNHVHGLPFCLADDLSQSIFNQINLIQNDIQTFQKQPWYGNVIELFAEAVIHPRTSTVCYTPTIGLFVLKYNTGHLLQYY